MKPPVIFLTFANSSTAHLELLEKERKRITQKLLPLANEQYIQLFAEPALTVDDLSKYLAQFKDRIALLHYAGHAGGDHLLLNDQSADADGVAQSLKSQTQLKLVFLNGCSTREQVEKLFEVGVPAVIATSVPVSDRSALEFAEVFYESLLTRHSLEEAFQLAAANQLMKGGEAIGVFRGIELPGQQEEELSWGLYIREEHNSPALDWKLPSQSSASFIVRGVARRYEGGFSMNSQLIETIANAIAPYSESIAFMIEQARAKGKSPKLRNLRAAIIDSFPTPIGTHLRKLVISEEISTDRLQKMVNVYVVTTEFLAYSLLAQLWDECVHNQALLIPDQQQDALQNFFQNKRALDGSVDYLPLIRTVSDLFEANDIDPFIEEFRDFRTNFFQNDGFQEAALFLDEMRKELEGDILADEIESFCVQAEEKLCIVFENLDFLAKYTLATIKTIELNKQRHMDPRYRHNLVILNQLTAAIGILDDVVESDSFSDNQSVVLLRDEEQLQPSLNLSPFIIDQNALSGLQNSKLYFYHFHPEDQSVRYLFVDNLKDEMIIKEGNFGYVADLFRTFLRVVVGI